MFGVTYIQIIKKENVDVTVQFMLIKGKITEGTIDQLYIPYQNNIKNIYLDQPMRKVYEYSDYVNYQNQLLYRYILPVTLTGTESNIYIFTPNTTQIQEGYSYFRCLYDTNYLAATKVLSNYLPYVAYGYSLTTSNSCIAVDSGKRNIIFKNTHNNSKYSG